MLKVRGRLYVTPWFVGHKDNNIPVPCSSMVCVCVERAAPSPRTVSALPCKIHPPRDFPLHYLSGEPDGKGAPALRCSINRIVWSQGFDQETVVRVFGNLGFSGM